jgi:diaminohydroxyphosphoribosylaminopyrimidine deaminase/5-amino-6-(5-phosphoribosylamino)uracil reductase
LISDVYWMRQALALGALGEGGTSPNPRVGCVLVRDDRPVGVGYHRTAGKAHAEVAAISDAGAAAKGATLYVNLEPCACYGRTPPCTDLLIDKGVARVVAAMLDPDPRVNGRGVAALRDAGIVTEIGLLEAEARELNQAFVHWHADQLPLVTLKAAISLDGMLSADAGDSRWITGPAARRFAHRLRLRHDAVLIGAGTLRADDPRLDVRLPGVDAPRLRVLVSSRLDIDPGLRLFSDAGGNDAVPLIYTSAQTDPERVERFTGRAEIVQLAGSADDIDLRAVLKDLGRRGVQSLLVEGGATVHASFLEHGLAQRVALFVSNKVLGGRGGRPLFDMQTVSEPSLGHRIDRTQTIAFGDDRLVLGQILPSSTVGA